MVDQVAESAKIRAQVGEARQALRVVGEIHRRIKTRPIAAQILELHHGGLIPADQLHRLFPRLELAEQFLPGVDELVATTNDLFLLYDMNEALLASGAVDRMLVQVEGLLDQLRTAQPEKRAGILEMLKVFGPYVQAIAETLRTVHS